MKKLKKVIGSVAFSFLIMGAVGSSMLLSVEKSNFANVADAEINSIIHNEMPEYWATPELNGSYNSIEKFGDSGNENLFLVEDFSSTFNLSIGNDTITREVEIINNDGSKNTANRTNYAYIPNKNNVEAGKEKEYFYFTYLNNVSLYYNVSRDEALQTTGLTNLLAKAPIDNFAKSHENSFAIEQDIRSTPQGFNISFGLGSDFGFSKSPTATDSHKVTLKEEGLYTLVIEPMVHRTTNDGFSYTSTPEKLYYSFYIFNSNVYFDSLTKIPTIKTEHVRTANVANNLYSQYYFYNYTDDIPKFSYNKNKFQLTVSYSDIDNITNVATVYVDDNDQIILQDSQGNVIENDNIFKFKYISGDEVILYFNDLGTYEIEYSFLYTVPEVKDEAGNVVSAKKQYYLPLNNLKGDNTTKFKSQNQRLFIYGFQTFHTDYNNPDLVTGTNKISEFKSFEGSNESGYTIDESADITRKLTTSEVNTAPNNTYWSELDPTEIENESDNFVSNIKTQINSLTPVKTNQPPIKFLNLAKVDNERSAILQVTKVNGEIKLEHLSKFNGFNQNSTGTYLYILQYQFENLVSGSGSGQSTFYNLQVLYFTIENTTPAVNVKTDEGENGKDVYAKDFTNKSVVITDLSSVSAFDANVTINLTIRQTNAQGQILLEKTNINNLPASERNDIRIENIDGTRKVYISNAGRYKNSHVTIEIYSASSNEPNVRTFTIDKTEIGKISARNVSAESSTRYDIANTALSTPLTNQPLIFSWQNKDSGAQTYGYYKFFPIKELTYFSETSQTGFLTELIEKQMLPTNAMLDLSSQTGASDWTSYSNSVDFNQTIDASYVRSSAGLYIFEVYDQAGNVNFDAYFIDNTKPTFVLNSYNKESGVNSKSVLTANYSLSVNEVYDYHVQWAENKAIYVKYPSGKGMEDFFENVKQNAFNDSDKLDSMLRTFFSENSKKLTTTATPPNPEISSYSSDYITVKILDDVYVKDATESQFKLKGTDSNQQKNEYYIDLFKIDNGETVASEGTHQVILRDMSNTLLSADSVYGYLNAPSAFVTINVTSDSSALKIVYADNKDQELNKSNFEYTGLLYVNEDGTQTSTNKQDGFDLSSNLNYKLSFLTPISVNEKQILLSFKPANEGAIVESVSMTYYAFTKKSDTFEGNVGKKDENNHLNNIAHFYTLEEEPSINNHNVFKYDAQVHYDDIIELPISTVGKYAEPGKYIFTRRYRTMPNSNKYDYFERQITMIVDNFNVISSQEQVSNKVGEITYSSAESYVGGDILLSMYSNPGQSSLEISFPRYNSEGLNQGSFYKQQNGNTPTFSVETNKLPLTLNIPTDKYTTHYSYDAKTNTYTVYSNNELSNYGGAKYTRDNEGNVIASINGVEISCKNEQEARELIQRASIAEYKLYAQITFTDAFGNKKLYKTNGNSVNGYLSIYQVSAFDKDVDQNAQPVQFTSPGSYVVELFQASNSVDDSIRKSYKFSFEIESNKPEFDILDSRNMKLESEKNSNQEETGNHFTNSQKLVIRWTDTDNKYLANIDKNAIRYSIYSASGGNLHRETVTNINSNNKVNTFDIDLAKYWQNGNYVDITMQFEGHEGNEEYYSTTTKRVYIDFTAPTQTLSSLMNNVTNAVPNFTKAFLESYTRDLYNAQNEKVEHTDMNTVSYSYTKNEGQFKNYSYMVNINFFSGMKQKLSENDNFGTKFAFYRKIEDLTTYVQVTKDNFSNNSSSHTSFEFLYLNSLENNKYYEIVERDMAGNMVVYLVKLIDSNAIASEKAITYTNDLLESLTDEEKSKSLTNEEAIKGVNIYSSTGLKFQSLQFLNDDWAVYITTAQNNTVAFMTSPNLDKGRIYKISILSNGTLGFEEVGIETLFFGVTSSNVKHNMQIANRLEGKNSNIKVSIMNASLRTETGNDNGDPYLKIAHPTNEQVESNEQSHIFPVAITIEQLTQIDSTKSEWSTLKAFTNASGNPNGWESTETVIFNYSADGYLYIYIRLGANNQPIRYTITDNFGNKTIVHQKANSENFDEITGDANIYQKVDSLGDITYISSKAIILTYQDSLFNVRISQYNNNDTWEPVTLKSESKPNSKDLFTIRFDRSDIVYRVQLVDKVDTNTIAKTMYIKVYDKLPKFSDKKTGNYITFKDASSEYIGLADTQQNLRVEFDGKTYIANASVISTFSNNVVLSAYPSVSANTNEQKPYLNQYKYSLHISKDDGKTWEEIKNPNSYIISGVGDYLILAKYDSEDVLTNECSLFILQINDSSKVFYTIYVDGKKVEKSDIVYTAPNGKQYDTNYMVNMRYSDKVPAKPGDSSVIPKPNIIPNDELGVQITLVEEGIATGTDVMIDIYQYRSDVSSGYFTIIYIPKSSSFLKQLYYTNESGVRKELIDKNSESIIVEKNKSNFSEVKLSWTSHYGIKENKIEIEISKLYQGRYVLLEDMPVYYDQASDTNYVYLTRAGSYQIKFHDSTEPENNVHKFGSGDYFSLIFLNTSPFVVTYTDPISLEAKTTEPINHAIYNGAVQLSLVDLNTYFTTAGYPQIHVTKNGKEYTGFTLANYVYTFTEPGYYKVTFSAQDKSSSTAIREEEYVFTILNPKESVLSYEITPYKNYYIEKIEKYNSKIEERVDITDELVKIIGNNLLTINDKDYLTRVLLSFSDELTGQGRYIITINTNDKSYSPITESKFTFMLWINSQVPPIAVSIADGGSTDGIINIDFNAKNIYETIGDCYIQIGSSRFDINEETLENYGGGLSITESGTYYIQVFTQSGVLLYSYKVIKTTPLNAWAIIAIVIAVVAAVAITIITIKLRKKPKVK